MHDQIVPFTHYTRFGQIISSDFETSFLIAFNWIHFICVLTLNQLTNANGYWPKRIMCQTQMTQMPSISLRVELWNFWNDRCCIWLIYTLMLSRLLGWIFFKFYASKLAYRFHLNRCTQFGFHLGKSFIFLLRTKNIAIKKWHNIV